MRSELDYFIKKADDLKLCIPQYINCRDKKENSTAEMYKQQLEEINLTTAQMLKDRLNKVCENV